MAKLDDAINALRDLSEREAEQTWQDAETALQDSTDELAVELAHRGDRLGSADAQFVGEKVSQVVEERVVPKILSDIAQTTARGLVLFETQAGIASTVTVEAAISKSVALASSWVTTVPDAQAVFAERLMAQAVTEPLPVPKIIKLIREQFAGDTSSSIRTLVETTLHNADQLIIDQIVGSVSPNIDLDFYTGPDDRIARPICHHMVNKVFPREAMRQCDNGQLPDFLMTRGGYNCRHRRRPVTRTELKYFPAVIEIVQPYRMVTEVVSGAKAKVVRTITYPVKAESVN